MTALAFETLTRTNITRCTVSWQMPLSAWSRADWLIAIGGELGEALNIVKKLNRDAGGWAGNTVDRESLQAALADELADVVIYLDLFVASVGLQLVTIGRAGDFAVLRAGILNILDGERVGLSERGRLALAAMGDLSKHIIRLEEYGPACWRLLGRVDALALEADIDLGAAVIAKFNRTSEKLGFPERLAA